MSSRAASAEGRLQCDGNCRSGGPRFEHRTASALELEHEQPCHYQHREHDMHRRKGGIAAWLRRWAARVRVAPAPPSGKQPRSLCPHGHVSHRGTATVRQGSPAESRDSGVDSAPPSPPALAQRHDAWTSPSVEPDEHHAPLGPLHLAAVKGKVRVLCQLLATHAVFVDLPDADGLTPLMFALLAGNIKCAEQLRRLGAQLDACDKHGRTALHFVAFNGAFRSLRWLLNRGADWRLRDNNSRTVLHYACDHASVRCLHHLLSRMPLSMLDDTDQQGMTPLLWAAHHGHVAHLRLLLTRGANAEAVDAQGRTALHFAAARAEPACVRCLLPACPRAVGACDSDGRTPLHLACMHGGFDVAMEILTGMDAQMAGSSASWLPALRDASGRSPLHCAAVVGSTPLVKELVRRGHTPRCHDDDGRDPEFYARLQGHHLTAEVLAHAASLVGCLPLDLGAVPLGASR